MAGSTHLSTQLCFENYKGRAVGPRQYAPTFPDFLGMKVDEIQLEMVIREFAKIVMLAEIANIKDVAVGIADVKAVTSKLRKISLSSHQWARSGARGVDGSITGQEAGELGKAMGAGLVISCHYEMFEFNSTSPQGFVDTAVSLGQPYRLLKCGERLSL